MKAVCSYLLFFSFASIAPGQMLAQTRADLLTAIRKDYQSINKDSTLKKKTLENDEFMENMTDGGGEISGFYKQDTLVKIYEWLGLSYGNRTREFYFRKDRLFFVYEKFESFIVNNGSGEMDHSKVRTSFEGRYYFDNDKLIDQKVKGKRTFDDQSAGIEKKLLSAANDDSKLLMKKRK